ncbi:TIR domain-containing adapter molecule 1 [Onychostruthus taczanowskii]|uniref:TIR domain-containing adapter molecule 1 n=1 Tax=Onychostruthus taczanowskii TaxID=356909 RepID=UPI001B803A1B|nr:TIR domain-containing adapter molecule 1 [Onychostruthus taczanowskii]
MAQSAELQPSFEDAFNILSRAPPEKLLSLKLRLKHLIPGPCSRLLQAMVLLTLGQETEARICLDALRDNQAAQYVHQIKLGAAGVREGGEEPQPPQLDAGAVALLAQVYTVLAQEQLCSPEARDNACHASEDAQQGTLNNMPPKEQEQGSAASGGSGDRFGTLRSHEDAGFPHTASSPVEIRGSSDLSGPRTLCSVGSSSLSSCLEISASPTAAFHTQPSVPECVPWPSRAGDTQSHGPQECSWASTPSSPPGQDTAAQGPQAEEVLQVSPCQPSPLPIPTPLPSEATQSSDASSTVTEPHTPGEKQDERQDKQQHEKQLSADVPDSRAAVDTAPALVSIQDSHIPAGIPCNSAPAASSTCSLPPPTYSFSSTLPPLQESPSKPSYPSPLHSSPSPARPPAPPAMDPSEPEGAKFFTFVVLHASEDEIVAHQVKNLLESMGVSNGATLSEDFFIAGRSHMICFQEAMENSAFMILLLTKYFPCNLCLYQTDTALMQSIMDPSKKDSVIPFLPKANALESSQIPSMLSVLVTLNESSPLFPRKVHKTFNPEKIREKKAMWDQLQRRKLQARWEQQQAQQKLAALSLGSPPCGPPAAPWPGPPGPPAQPWCPPAPMDPPPAQRGPPPCHAQLPPGHYSLTAGQAGVAPLIIQHARMVQIGNHNVMQVETAPAGPGHSQEQSRHSL